MKKLYCCQALKVNGMPGMSGVQSMRIVHSALRILPCWICGWSDLCHFLHDLAGQRQGPSWWNVKRVKEVSCQCIGHVLWRHGILVGKQSQVSIFCFHRCTKRIDYHDYLVVEHGREYAKLFPGQEHDKTGSKCPEIFIGKRFFNGTLVQPFLDQIKQSKCASLWLRCGSTSKNIAKSMTNLHRPYITLILSLLIEWEVLE